MAQWFFEVADCFDFDRGVVSIALNYLDRVLIANQRTNKFTTKEELQLTAVTTLYLAMKLHGEIHPVKKRGRKYERKKLTIEAFVVLSKHQFDAATIEAMERTLLSILNWQLNPPDARSYVACMLELMPQRDQYLREWQNIFDIGRYVAELSLGESDLLFQVRPSVVGLASILCAINCLGKAARPLPPVHVLENMSNRIFQATSLGLDTDIVTKTATRLARLCPSIFVKDSSPVRRKRKSSSSTSYTYDDVSIDEIVDRGDAPSHAQRKTSPVCVESFNDNPFLVKAGRHRKRR
jgi:hypothetical protein